MIAIGAIWVCKAVCASACCCLRRLQKVIIEPPGSQSHSEGDESEATPAGPQRRRSKDQSSAAMGESPPSAEELNEAGTPSEAEPRLRKRGSRARSAEGTMSRPSSTPLTRRRQSGSASRSLSRSKGSQAGVAVNEAVNCAADGAERAALSAEMAAAAAGRAAVSAERASMLLHQALTGPVTRPSPARRNAAPGNPWNRFQQEHAGRGWSMDKMRAEYFKAKCQSTMP